MQKIPGVIFQNRAGFLKAMLNFVFNRVKIFDLQSAHRADLFFCDGFLSLGAKRQARAELFKRCAAIQS